MRGADVRRGELAAIFLGGALGATLRVWLGRQLGTGAASWPWVTFAVNASGSFALALIATRLVERDPVSRYWRRVLGIGFCGAYTTFSTMQAELLTMVQADRYVLAASYALASVAAGYAAILLGTALARGWGTIR